MSDNVLHKEALSAAIKHIGIATYSSGKITRYLLDKGFPESVVSAVVSELIEREYINDRKASRKVLIARTGKKQESRDYIYKRLLGAGIDPVVAEEVAASLPSDNDTCLELYNSLGYDEDSEETRDAMIDIAIRRGYNYETASSAYAVWSEK